MHTAGLLESVHSVSAGVGQVVVLTMDMLDSAWLWRLSRGCWSRPGCGVLCEAATFGQVVAYVAKLLGSVRLHCAVWKYWSRTDYDKIVGHFQSVGL